MVRKKCYVFIILAINVFTMFKVFNINKNVWLINTSVIYTYNMDMLKCKLNINISILRCFPLR